MTDVLVITGVSGAGRSTAAAVLEDLGWYVVDNLPTSLVEKIVELASAPGSGITKLALVAGRQHVDLIPKIALLRAAGHRVRLLYLDAETRELVRRYDSTRRRHPLDAEADGLVEAIELERAQLGPVRDMADMVIDSTDLNVNTLKTRLLGMFEEDNDGGMLVALESFGFKHGMPLDADIVLDVRFLPNPHWEPTLRPLTGLDGPVREYVLAAEGAGEFLDRMSGLLEFLLPAYVKEGKSYLTVAVGCTGGRHRSVALVEELARRLSAAGHTARIGHRDVGR
jgi:RNase adapter protein RapZ